MLENEAARAATMLGASGGLFAEIGASLSPDEAQTRERVTAYVSAELGAERAEELRGEGAAMALDELLDDVASGS
jgi:hypothetical protein